MITGARLDRRCVRLVSIRRIGRRKQTFVYDITVVYDGNMSDIMQFIRKSIFCLYKYFSLWRCNKVAGSPMTAGIFFTTLKALPIKALTNW